MTAPTLAKGRRLLAVEREIRLLRKALPEALQLKVDNGILIAATRRLLGENDALRRNVEALKAELLKRGRAA